jgi:hypothetical protein
MRLTSVLAERSGTERDDGFVLKGVAALTTRTIYESRTVRQTYSAIVGFSQSY